MKYNIATQSQFAIELLSCKICSFYHCIWFIVGYKMTKNWTQYLEKLLRYDKLNTHDHVAWSTPNNSYESIWHIIIFLDITARIIEIEDLLNSHNKRKREGNTNKSNFYFCCYICMGIACHVQRFSELSRLLDY